MIVNGITCISIEDARKLLKEHIGFEPAKSTIYKYIKEGKLPKPLPFRSGRTAFFDLDELIKSAKNNFITYLQ